jgi:replication-associated recombination protein RarA
MVTKRNPANVMVNVEKTPNGYYYDEVMSAVQKEIRRGNVWNAVYWALELESFTKLDGAKILWNRLKVISSEDIGIANPIAPVVIQVLEEQYSDAKRRKNSSFREFLTNAVIFLARCNKCRITDNLLISLYGGAGDPLKPPNHLTMPDYAIDGHTVRGTVCGKGDEEFEDEIKHLANETIDDLYKETASKILLKYGNPFK